MSDPASAAWRVIVALTLFCVMAWQPVCAQPAATFDTFVGQVSPDDLVPGADRFGPTQQAPPVAQVFRGDQLVGYAYLNSQYVNANGYSSKPIHVLVGLDTTGTIVGVELVHHDEPIVLVGISEQRVIDYVEAFVGYNPLRAAATGEGPPNVDLVSGATVTVLVMGESVTRSALRVARLLGLDGSGGPAAAAAPDAPAAADPTPRALDPEAGEIAGWQQLVEEGAVAHLALSVGEVNDRFAEAGDPEAARRPQAGAPDDPFIDLYVALVSQPAIGRSLLGEAEYANVLGRLAPDQHAILVGGSGLYSFKGSGYVRGGIFDRIELIQGAETVRFRDYSHRRVGTIAAEGAPALKEIGIFVIPEGAEFDPAQPWRLQLLVQRATGALTRAFVSFDLPYSIPARYTTGGEPAHAGAAAGATAWPAPAPGAAGGVDSHAFMEDDTDPLWKRMWQSKVVAIAMLGLMLVALTLIFFFQDALVKHELLYDRIRLAYLALTLFWLGWVAQAQLSVVNVLTFASSLREGFQWSSFLIDPLIFILWSSVAVALIFWGRGAFCGWLCPFGALQELTNRAAKALKVPQLKIPWGVHERLWPIKYIIFLVLFGVSLGSLAFSEQLAEIEPFKTAIVLRFMREWWFVLFAVALLVAGLFVERFFCRYMCPLGAALAIPGRLRMFDWLKRYRECGNPCMRCFKECPVEAIHPEGHINPNECISCLHCQVLYHSDQKCPVQIKKRLKRERRAAAGKQIPLAVMSANGEPAAADASP